MIEIDNNVFIEDFIKGVKIRPTIGDVKIYFSDRTATTFPDEYRMSAILDKLVAKGFIQVDNDYINPNLVKGFENLKDGRIKMYFPDTTALTLYLDDDAYEDLKVYFSNNEGEE